MEAYYLLHVQGVPNVTPLFDALYLKIKNSEEIA